MIVILNINKVKNSIDTAKDNQQFVNTKPITLTGEHNIKLEGYQQSTYLRKAKIYYNRNTKWLSVDHFRRTNHKFKGVLPTASSR